MYIAMMVPFYNVYYELVIIIVILNIVDEMISLYIFSCMYECTPVLVM